MQSKPFPEIDKSDLKAAREFLTSILEDERRERAPRPHREPHGPVTVSLGISRARNRSLAKTSS